MARVRRWLKALCLGGVLAVGGCGGGGDHTTINLVYKRWQGTELADRAIAVVPGGGHALVGDVPEVDWLAFQTDNGDVDLYQTRYTSGVWQTGATPRAAEVHGLVFGDNGLMARSGDWTVFVGRDEKQIWAQFKGPGGVSSTYWPLSSNADPLVHAVVNASGRARIYWSETTGSVAVVRAMHFNGINAVDDGQVSGMSMDVQQVVAGPDGRGWLFYRYGGAQYVRTVDALVGLGAPIRLDEAVHGTAGPARWAAAESTGVLTTLALQNIGTASPCVGVRRLQASAWASTECINTDTAQVVGGQVADLAVEPGGRAMAVWSGGLANRTLYAASRRADGGWSAPSAVATLATGGRFLSVQARIHTDGAAVVAYRQAFTAQEATPHAVVLDAVTQAWSTPERFDAADGGASARLSVAFNSRGEPGVLNFASAANGRYTVRFATRVRGQWTAASLQNDANLARDSLGIELASMQRLMPLGDGGWAAFWELTSNLVPGYGRRVVAASYQ